MGSQQAPEPNCLSGVKRKTVSRTPQFPPRCSQGPSQLRPSTAVTAPHPASPLGTGAFCPNPSRATPTPSPERRFGTVFAPRRRWTERPPPTDGSAAQCRGGRLKRRAQGGSPQPLGPRSHILPDGSPCSPGGASPHDPLQRPTPCGQRTRAALRRGDWQDRVRPRSSSISGEKEQETLGRKPASTRCRGLDGKGENQRRPISGPKLPHGRRSLPRRMTLRLPRTRKGGPRGRPPLLRSVNQLCGNVTGLYSFGSALHPTRCRPLPLSGVSSPPLGMMGFDNPCPRLPWYRNADFAKRAALPSQPRPWPPAVPSALPGPAGKGRGGGGAGPPEACPPLPRPPRTAQGKPGEEHEEKGGGPQISWPAPLLDPCPQLWDAHKRLHQRKARGFDQRALARLGLRVAYDVICST